MESKIDIEVRRETSDQIQVSQVLVDAMKELYQNNLGPSCPPIHPEYDAVCAYGKYTGILLGVITYRKYPSYIWINIGYVCPDARRLGIYTAMWRELVDIARESNIGRIEGSTHLNNAAMRAVYKKLGRTETFVTGTYYV